MKKIVKQVLVGVFAVSLCSSGLATDPRVVKMGGVNMIPTLSITSGDDDNPFSQTIDPEDSNVTTITPGLDFIVQKDDDVYSLSLNGTRGIFHDSSDDNYTDGSAEFAADVILGAKSGFTFSAGYLEGHEDRGSGATQGIGEFLVGPTEYSDTTFDGTFRIGGLTSKARLELSASYLDKEFDNFLAINADREREENAYGAKFYYAVSEDTNLTFEVRSIDLEYDTGVRDSDEVEYFVGVEWQATAKTSGYIKVGRGDKDFDNDAIEDEDAGLSWDVGIAWEPRTYSVFSLYTSKEEEETPSTGDFVDTTSYGVSWNHDWSDKFSTELAYSNLDQDYVGSLQEDETDTISASVIYAFDRWMDISLTFEDIDKSSSIDLLEYDRQKLYLGLDLSL